jgi:hypothetical protein
MRRLVLSSVVVVFLAAVALVVIVVWSRHHDVGDPSVAANVPVGAAATVKQLTTGDSPADQRGAVDPALAAELPPGQLFPAGTSFSQPGGSWSRSGSYAHLTGTLQEPGKAPAQVEIGLMLSGGRWLVTFEESL